MTLAIIQVAYRMPFATQAGAAQKILMKRGGSSCFTGAISRIPLAPPLHLRNERSLINGQVFSPSFHFNGKYLVMQHYPPSVNPGGGAWESGPLPHTIMYHSKSFVAV